MLTIPSQDAIAAHGNANSTRKKRLRCKGCERLFRVLLCDSIDKAGEEILTDCARVDSCERMREEDLLKIIGEYDALVVRSGTKVSEEVINQGHKLKIIGRAGVGVDNVAVEAATQRGIFVVNSPRGNTVAAAELTIALMMALARKIAQADASVARGEWRRSAFIGSQLQQKTLGIIGLGQVGTYVARVGQALGMSVLAFDPYVTFQKAESLNCQLVELSFLLSSSDFITLHVPLLPHTRHLINAESLLFVKKSACIINASRGGVVDENALASALLEGRLGGAALDVFENEGTLPENHVLLSVRKAGKNILFTPHIGASTVEAQRNVAVDVAMQVKVTLLGGLPSAAVNLQVVQAKHLKDFLHLADILGRLCSKLVDLPVQQLHLKLRGEPARPWKDGDADALLLAAAQGMLRTRCDGVVNFVNVKRIAEEHRIELILSKEEAGDARREVLLELSLKTARENAVLAGCTYGSDLILKNFLGIPIELPIPAAATHLGSNGSRRSSTSSVGRSSSNSAKGSSGWALQHHQQMPTSEGVALASITSAAATVDSANIADTTSRQEAAAVVECNGMVQQQHGCSSSNLEGEGGDEETDEEDGFRKPLYMMYTIHRDEPGSLASVALVLADAGVNIANCHLGRKLITHSPTTSQQQQSSPVNTQQQLHPQQQTVIHQQHSTEQQPNKHPRCVDEQQHEQEFPLYSQNLQQQQQQVDSSHAQQRYAESLQQQTLVGEQPAVHGTLDAIQQQQLRKQQPLKQQQHQRMMGLCIFVADSEISDELVQKVMQLDRVQDCKVFATPQSLGLDTY